MAEKTEAGETVRLDDAELRRRLTPEQYRVAREKGTEPAFTGAYWNTKTPGTYRCICCDAPLFDAADKYDSGTGWPSFTRPIAPGRVAEARDASLGMIRTEALCRNCDAHLGHVFDDGPPGGGQRYCLNSASLRLEPGDE